MSERLLICRRCGEPRDDAHVPSPYLCVWNPEKARRVLDRAAIKAKLRIVTGDGKS